MKKQKRLFALSLLFVCCAIFGRAQVPVGMAPPIHFQFFNANGQPLANGKIFTYAAGTTTCSNTYSDASGTSQNPCVLLLDGTGSPANGSVQVGIFLADQAYKFVAFDANNVFQWQVDNVTTYFALLNAANIWTATQTFSGQIIDTLTDNQIALGTPGNQTTIDAPPPLTPITIHLPTTSDTLVGQQTADTLQNKTLIAPQISQETVNGTPVVNTPGTYVNVANANPTGTSGNSPVKLINAPSQATVSTTSDTGGLIGIAVSGTGTTGNVTVQQSGLAFCNFDGATTAGDYVQNSLTNGGTCHDAGAILPSSGQVLGRVLSTNAGVGAYTIDIFPPEITGAISSFCPDPTATQVTPVSTSNTVIKTCKIPAGTLNTTNAAFRMTTDVLLDPQGGTPNASELIAWGTNTTLGTGSQQLSISVAASAQANTQVQVMCLVRVPGSTATIICNPIVSATAGSGTLTIAPVAFVMTGDLTADFYIGEDCKFSNISSSPTCTEHALMVERVH